MRFLPTLAALRFAIFVTAQNFSSYVPECAPPCVQQALNSTKLCTGLNDNKCLCTDFQQLILPARLCFVSTCNVSNIEQLRSNITSGWQKFCNDSGVATNITAIDSSIGFGPPQFGGGPPGGQSWGSQTSSLPSSTVLSTSSPTASDNTSSSAASGLSTGQKAGIGVGVGVGSLALIGGLVFFGFRLGQRRRKGGKVEAGVNGDHAEDGNAGSTTAGTALDTAGGDWAFKKGPEDVAFAELSSEAYLHPELSGLDVRRELPVTERPVELWHGAMPSELSADSEVSRGPARDTAR